MTDKNFVSLFKPFTLRDFPVHVQIFQRATKKPVIEILKPREYRTSEWWKKKIIKALRGEGVLK